MYYPLKHIKNQESRDRYKIWFDQAIHDVQAAMHSREDGFFEWACYQAVQGVEKSLKSIILKSGWGPPRTHKLPVLIAYCNNLNTDFRSRKFVFRDLELFTYISRYPFLIPGEMRSPHDFIDASSADKCIAQAREISDVVADVLKVILVDIAEYEDIEHIEKIDLQNRLNFVTKQIHDNMDTECIVLFGSYSQMQRTEPSTLDILILANTDLSYIDRVKKIREITKGGQPVVEPLVYTPKEFEAIVATDKSFCEDILVGQVLFAKPGINLKKICEI